MEMSDQEYTMSRVPGHGESGPKSERTPKSLVEGVKVNQSAHYLLGLRMALKIINQVFDTAVAGWSHSHDSWDLVTAERLEGIRGRITRIIKKRIEGK